MEAPLAMQRQLHLLKFQAAIDLTFNLPFESAVPFQYEYRIASWLELFLELTC